MLPSLNALVRVPEGTPIDARQDLWPATDEEAGIPALGRPRWEIRTIYRTAAECQRQGTPMTLDFWALWVALSEEEAPEGRELEAPYGEETAERLEGAAERALAQGDYTPQERAVWREQVRRVVRPPSWEKVS